MAFGQISDPRGQNCLWLRRDRAKKTRAKKKQSSQSEKKRTPISDIETAVSDGKKDFSASRMKYWPFGHQEHRDRGLQLTHTGTPTPYHIAPCEIAVRDFSLESWLNLCFLEFSESLNPLGRDRKRNPHSVSWVELDCWIARGWRRPNHVGARCCYEHLNCTWDELLDTSWCAWNSVALMLKQLEYSLGQLLDRKNLNHAAWQG